MLIRERHLCFIKTQMFRALKEDDGLWEFQ